MTPENFESSYTYDDTGDAMFFADHFRDIARYSYSAKTWYKFTGKYWTEDMNGGIRKLMNDAIKLRQSEATDEEQVKADFVKHMKRLRSASSKKAVLDEAEHLLAVSPEDFDKDKMLFNCENGVFDLEEGRLKKHDASLFMEHHSDVTYDKNAKAPQWEQFLKEIFNADNEVIEFIQSVIGYALTGDTSEQVMFFLIGKGRDGKSVFLEIISQLVGTYSKNIQSQTLMAKTNFSSANPDIARLKSTRVVTSSEINKGNKLDESLVKQLTGNDVVTARFLYGRYFEFRPQFKVFMALNYTPLITGVDDGIWRRLIFLNVKQVPKEEQDRGLVEKLKKELSGILNWAIEGCCRWLKEGLVIPEKIIETTTTYRREMNPIEEYIQNKCVLIPGARTPASTLYDEYKLFSGKSTTLSQSKFGTYLREMGLKSLKTSGVKVYEGIEIKPKQHIEFLK